MEKLKQKHEEMVQLGQTLTLFFIVGVVSFLFFSLYRWFIDASPHPVVAPNAVKIYLLSVSVISLLIARMVALKVFFIFDQRSGFYSRERLSSYNASTFTRLFFLSVPVMAGFIIDVIEANPMWCIGLGIISLGTMLAQWPNIKFVKELYPESRI